MHVKIKSLLVNVGTKTEFADILRDYKHVLSFFFFCSSSACENQNYGFTYTKAASLILVIYVFVLLILFKLNFLCSFSDFIVHTMLSLMMVSVCCILILMFTMEMALRRHFTLLIGKAVCNEKCKHGLGRDFLLFYS